MNSDNTGLIFRLADADEKASVLKLYESVKGTEFCAWDESYPSMAEIENDFNSDCLYVLSEGETIAGALSVVPENELDGFDCWEINDGTQREIARIVISPNCRGRGYARAMINAITDILTSTPCNAIHLSASVKNLPALKNYEKLGFTIRQRADIYDGEYYLLEKNIYRK